MIVDLGNDVGLSIDPSSISSVACSPRTGQDVRVGKDGDYYIVVSGPQVHHISGPLSKLRANSARLYVQAAMQEEHDRRMTAAAADRVSDRIRVAAEEDAAAAAVAATAAAYSGPCPASAYGGAGAGAGDSNGDGNGDGKG